MKKLIPALITLKQKLDNGKIEIPEEVVPHQADLVVSYNGVLLPIKVRDDEASLAVREE